MSPVPWSDNAAVHTAIPSQKLFLLKPTFFMGRNE